MGKRTATNGFVNGFAVTPHDTNPLAGGSVAGFYVGVTGDVKVTMIDGTTPTWPALAAGVPHPIQCTHIWSTGTTATGIVAGRN